MNRKFDLNQIISYYEEEITNRTLLGDFGRIVVGRSYHNGCACEVDCGAKLELDKKCKPGIIYKVIKELVLRE